VKCDLTRGSEPYNSNSMIWFVGRGRSSENTLQSIPFHHLPPAYKPYHKRTFSIYLKINILQKVRLWSAKRIYPGGQEVRHHILPPHCILCPDRTGLIPQIPFIAPRYISVPLFTAPAASRRYP
jgi:hypothetical protein